MSFLDKHGFFPISLYPQQVTFSLQASSTKIISDDDEHPGEMTDYDKAEEIVREAMRTVQKTAAEVASSSSIVASPPRVEEPPLSPKTDLPPSPKADTSRRESTSSTSSSSSSTSAVKKVVVRYFKFFFYVFFCFLSSMVTNFVYTGNVC